MYSNLFHGRIIDSILVPKHCLNFNNFISDEKPELNYTNGETPSVSLIKQKPDWLEAH